MKVKFTGKEIANMIIPLFLEQPLILRCRQGKWKTMQVI